MNPIESSELIINSRGALYHINCRPEEVAPTIITVGDPDRVGEVSKHFDRIEFKNAHREFITHTGYLGRKRISVTSTGIGPDNIDIVLNEMDALFNIDLDQRIPKESLTPLRFIRIGTSGSLQADVPVDSWVASTHAIGLDNLMHYYTHSTHEEESQILQGFMRHTRLDESPSLPYISSAGMSLLKEFVDGFHQGITVTCPGFYGPQGRILRMGLTQPRLTEQLTTFRFGNHRITNFEMETSAIYGMGKVLGHACLSLSAIVANRVNRTFSERPAETMEKLILTTLDNLSTLPG